MTRHEPNQPAAARNLISPFPFPLRGKPGRAGSPHAAHAGRQQTTPAAIDAAAPPARGISKRSAEIPLARFPCRPRAGIEAKKQKKTLADQWFIKVKLLLS
jgi:hypothetical protein